MWGSGSTRLIVGIARRKVALKYVIRGIFGCRVSSRLIVLRVKGRRRGVSGTQFCRLVRILELMCIGRKQCVLLRMT